MSIGAGEQVPSTRPEPSPCGVAGHRRRVGPLVVVGTLIVIAGLTLALSGRFGARDAAGASATVPNAPRAEGVTPTRVEVIGDSLIHQSHDLLVAALTADDHSPTIASKPSQPLGSEFIQTALAETETRPSDVVVLATAANDVLAEAHLAGAFGAEGARAAYRTLLTDTIARYPGRCVVVVNARDVSPLFNPAQADLLNADIEMVAAAHDNVVVVDWASASRSHTDDWFFADLEHFGPDPNSTANLLPGAQAYAELIADGVTGCRARTA
jgi:hypothetical protein